MVALLGESGAIPSLRHVSIFKTFEGRKVAKGTRRPHEFGHCVFDAIAVNPPNRLWAQRSLV